jgi:hypothetical protein
MPQGHLREKVIELGLRDLALQISHNSVSLIASTGGWSQGNREMRQYSNVAVGMRR